jgi:agmatinase
MAARFLKGIAQDYQTARFVVLPCPHEATTSYGHGTRRGPAAILRASQQLELFDEELGYEPHLKGPIYTEKPVPAAGLRSAVARIIKAKKIPVILGGEHSLTPLAVRELAKKYRDLSVLQLDAHADLRDTYQGLKQSHACALRRVLEICPAVQVGIRSLSAGEWQWAQNSGQAKKVHFASKLEETPRIESQLSRHVYITIDVDVFDPAVIPATGTPEPGGLFWYEVLEILKGVCATKKVVGCDIVELSPRRSDIVSDFTVAKLVYKLIGYLAG